MAGSNREEFAELPARQTWVSRFGHYCSDDMQILHTVQKLPDRKGSLKKDLMGCPSISWAGLVTQLPYSATKTDLKRGAGRGKMTSDGYGEAYQRGFDLTVRLLISRGVQRDDAEEVAQAAWVKGWERLSQLRKESVVVIWVNTIALNAYRNWLRRERLSLATQELRYKTAAIDLAAIDVARILGSCRPCDRHLLEQSMTGVTPSEIAVEQGVTETAIRIRLLRARREARSRAERKTFPCGGGEAAIMVNHEAA